MRSFQNNCAKDHVEIGYNTSQCPVCQMREAAKYVVNELHNFESKIALREESLGS